MKEIQTKAIIRIFTGLLIMFFRGFLPGAHAQTDIHLFYSGDINGVVKAELPDRRGDILRIRTVMQGLQKELGDRSLFFDTGDALAYHYLSRMDSGMTTMSNMIEAGYDAMVCGNLDLKYGVENIRRFSDTASFEVLAANLIRRPDSSAVFSPYRIYRKQGIDIGVVGWVAEDLPDQIQAEKRETLAVESRRSNLITLIDSLRAHCDALVLLSHMDPMDNLLLARETSGIDVILGKPADDSTRHIFLGGESSTGRTHILTAPGFARGLGHLRLTFDTRGGAAKLTVVEPQADIGITHLSFALIDTTDYLRLENKFESYVRAKYRGYQPDQPLIDNWPGEREALMRLALFSLIRSTHSEIALLNYGALTSSFYNDPGDQLSIRDIERFTRPNDPVVTLRLTGKTIKSIITRSRQLQEGDMAALRHMTINDYGDILPPISPHGKSLVDDQIYAVATTLFLADGGDGYTGFLQGTHRRVQFAGKTRLLASDEAEARRVPLTDLLIYSIQEGLHPDYGDPENTAFYSRSSFLNRPLLQMRFENIDLSFKSVRVGNNEGFTNANDSRVSENTENATNIATSGYFGLVRFQPNIRWENGLLFRYGFQKIGNADTQESDDRLEYQSTLDWQDPFQIGKWDRAPLNLYTSLRFDTEFTRDSEAEADLPRRKDLYLYAGISSFGKNDREIRLALFAKNDFSNQDRDAGIELNLKYFKDFKWFGHGSLLRGRYLIKQSGNKPGDERALIDYTGYLDFQIARFLSLKPQINAFVYRDAILEKTATNIQFAINLSFSRLWKPQYIRFWRRDRS